MIVRISILERFGTSKRVPKPSQGHVLSTLDCDLRPLKSSMTQQTSNLNCIDFESISYVSKKPESGKKSVRRWKFEVTDSIYITHATNEIRSNIPSIPTTPSKDI